MKEEIQKRMTELLPGLMKSPRLYVHDIDWQKGTALVVEADDAFYKQALALDRSILKGVKFGAHVRLDRLFEIMSKSGTGLLPARFIFHTGQAGATLMSKLLDEIPGVLGIREPLPLLNFAAVRNAMKTGMVPENEAAFRDMLRRGYMLLTRTFSSDQVVVIKASSVCNNLAQWLLGFHDQNRALCLYSSLETKLATVLVSAKTPDVDDFVNVRFHGLRGRFPNLSFNPEEITRPQLIALAWIVEALEFHALAQGPQAKKALFVNFEQFLKTPEKSLAEITGILKLPVTPDVLKAIESSDIFMSITRKTQPGTFVSKRKKILENSRIANAKAIEEGLLFAKNLGQAHPEIRHALKTFSGI